MAEADELDLTEVWTRALDSLGDQGMSSQQRAFVSLTKPLAIVEDTALIAAPNEFTKDVLESKLRPQVVEALSRTVGRDVRIAVTVDPSIAPALDDDATDDLADSTLADNLRSFVHAFVDRDEEEVGCRFWNDADDTALLAAASSGE